MIQEPDFGRSPSPKNGAKKNIQQNLKKFSRVVSSSMGDLNRSPLIFDERNKDFFSGYFSKSRLFALSLILFLVGMIVGINL